VKLGRLALMLVVVLLAAGCGGDDEATPADTGTTSMPAETTQVRVYFLRDGKVWPVSRDVAASSDRELTAEAMAQLFLGPTDREMTDLGLTTELNVEASETSVVDIADGFDLPGEQSDEALAQFVYTVTQSPTVESVEVEGVRYTRADFEDLTPAILVESPLSFEEVTSPLTVTGTANTFEANFQYELTDTDGLIVDENFVTATSGTGTRGTFEFTTDPFTVPFTGVGSLIVFESSAQDGSRINLVEIPLRMTK
jgi:hypothetical protein